MDRILAAAAAPSALLVELRKCLESEWGNIDPFEGNHREINIPQPLVAVDEQLSLLGGLVFSSFSKPGSPQIGVWINAVLVLPAQRKKGIASRLVQSAAVAAQSLDIEELFVMSEFPELYQKLGWRSVGLDSTKNGIVLTKSLATAS